SGASRWSRPVRFAGLQLASDFDLLPDIVTMPLPSFFGEAAVPSTVDVFVNSAHVFETGVGAGPFEINHLPVVTGNGEANIVVTDALGNRTAIAVPYFASRALLRKGLTAYAIDVGLLRRGFGQRSFDYGDPMANATWRYGLNNSVTLDAHGEAAAK